MNSAFFTPFLAALARAFSTASGTISAPYDARSAFCEAEAYRPCAAIKVKRCSARLGQGTVQCQLIEPFRLGRVYLVEGPRTQLELAAAEGIQKRTAAPERAQLPGKHGIARRGVDALDDADELWTGRAQRCCQRK